jgi:transitional endoplasmic reticulum ATPase
MEGDGLLEALQNALRGGNPINGDEVEFHDGPKISLPKGMTYEKAYSILERLEEEAETATSYNRHFRYRADDGAYATYMVIKEHYGMLLGKTSQGMSGETPSETRTIAIGVDQTMQVPWGRLEIPVFPGLELTLCDKHPDRDYGRIFEIHATGPRKYKDELEQFFDRVGEYLRTNSIYRGRAIIGSDDPEFLDLASFDASKIVFSDKVTTTLEGTLWASLRHTQAMRDNGVPLKRAVLAFGPFGTGKTSTGQLTAGIATENGWTFISARPGRDNVEDVLRTARLYQPAVVFIEDIDNATSSGEDDHVTKLLDAFDGITAKGGELMILMTTNHIDRIHKGMLRPGRLDAVIEIAELDEHGIERLIKAVVPIAKLSPTVDYVEVGRAMAGFYPAFVREAITRAVTFAISRLDGESNYLIDTPDLVGAAVSLLPQLELQDDAGEGVKKPDLTRALEGAVLMAVKQLSVAPDEQQRWALVESIEKD